VYYVFLIGRALFFLVLLALMLLFGFLTWYLWLLALPAAYAGVKLFGRVR
jgi:hypothetical protein